ncbi:MAG: LysM peptidoglycan-binding domain-containing protein [Verrucomicrobia bacterium]|nr:LysM peptidoglycan-binding domain-containing protein [Verrucomicrobiota bacterium]MBU6446291.1 LysM peptidoglycan-binding domain-containing protein [Verrucomicrobiota bacterium]
MITKKLKILSWALIFSGALNVAFIGALAYTRLENTAMVSTIMGKKEIVPTNVTVFNAMSRLTFRELVSYLTNRELIEEGYTKRDLAIAALVAYHHFNLEKALSGKPAQVRTLLFAKDQTIDMFPGLTEEQFEAVIRFAYQEKWPLTAKGLFALLQTQQAPRDESLEQAFLLTPEFYALQILFQKTNAPQEPSKLLDLAAEGSWNLLEKFFQEQSKALEFSEEKRRNLLLSYCALHSPTAAQLLLSTDEPFALKRLDDKQILDLLSLMKKQTEEGTRFCLGLLRSPRSDAIWQAAALTLYSYAGEMPPLPIDPQTVLARFAPESKESKAAPQPELAASPPCARYHVVKEGESLWKISRQYKVKVDELVRINGLEKDSLYPGMTLKLPR